MDKEEKKRLKDKFKTNEEDLLRASLPMSIENLKDLLSYLNRETAPACNHTLKEAVEFLESRHLDKSKIIPWLNEHGGYCDCEVIFNVYDDVGDILGWHLDEDA